MSQYIVSARKYRPTTFSTVVGQKALTSTLKNAIESDRLAHAYLFCGSRGVGKTSCARIFAKTINCTNRTPDGEACNECDSCRAFNDGNSMNIIELDAASHNGIEDIKNLIEQVQIPPTHGLYRVFIIDEVHMLSPSAFNAFLKTLEEPPSYVIFILATTEKHKIIPTILSRCQIYDFNRISIKDMVAHLRSVAQNENIKADEQALNVIARQADGAMRDALSIFDQIAASSRGDITYESTIENLNVLDSSYYVKIVECLSKGDIPGALFIYHEIRRKGFDSHFFLLGLGGYLRDLMLASSTATVGLIDEPDDVKQSMAAQASHLKPDFLYAAMGLCNDADLNYRTSGNKQLLVEITLIRIAQLLNPSPVKSGLGEGLKPLKKSAEPRQATPARPQTQVRQDAPPQPAEAAKSPEKPVVPEAAQARQEAPKRRTPGAGDVKVQRTAGASTLRVGDMSMHKTAEKEEAKVTIKRGRPFTEQMMKDAWIEMAKSYTAEPALANLLSRFVPEIAPDGRVVIVVDSPGTQAFMSQRFDEILPKMRDALVNDDFSPVFSVSNKGLGPEYWSDSQVLAGLLQNPDFAEFYRAFGLSLI